MKAYVTALGNVPPTTSRHLFSHQGYRLVIRSLMMSLLVLLGACASTGGGSGDGWYSVKRGDTMHGIANREGIPLLRLQRLNPKASARSLEVGQRLRLPDPTERAPGSGSYRYKVRSGDSLSSLAQEFSTTPAAIQRANSSLAQGNLQKGRLIIIPAGNVASSGGASAVRQRQIAAQRALPAEPIPPGVGHWPWPLQGANVTREFGPNTGGTLEPMLLTAGRDTTARAVVAGTVRFADQMRQLGHVVIIHSAQNMQVVYAQCGTSMVRVGQRVVVGTPVCQVTPGAASRQAQLLFDVRHGGKPVNPRRVLR